MLRLTDTSLRFGSVYGLHPSLRCENQGFPNQDHLFINQIEDTLLLSGEKCALETSFFNRVSDTVHRS